MGFYARRGLLLQQSLFGGGYRLGGAEYDDDIALFQSRFRCRFDGTDAATANGADFAAEMVEVELIQGAPDASGARFQKDGMEAWLVMIVDFIEVMVAGAAVETAQQAIALRACLANALQDAIDWNAQQDEGVRCEHQAGFERFGHNFGGARM